MFFSYLWWVWFFKFFYLVTKSSFHGHVLNSPYNQHMHRLNLTSVKLFNSCSKSRVKKPTNNLHQSERGSRSGPTFSSNPGYLFGPSLNNCRHASLNKSNTTDKCSKSQVNHKKGRSENTPQVIFILCNVGVVKTSTVIIGYTKKKKKNHSLKFLINVNVINDQLYLHISSTWQKKPPHALHSSAVEPG